MLAEKILIPNSQTAEDFNTTEFLKALGEGGGRLVQAAYASPWTGVPFTIMILAGLEKTFPGITQKYLNALGQFMGMLGKMAYEALLAIGNAASSQFNKPPVTLTAGSGNFCVKIDVSEGLRIAMSLGFIVNIPASQQCFPNAADRDAFYDQTVAAINRAGIGWGVQITKVG